MLRNKLDALVRRDSTENNNDKYDLLFLQIFYGYCINMVIVNYLGHNNCVVKVWYFDTNNFN